MEVEKNRNSVYQIRYHFVWCVKHRKGILIDQAVDDLKELFQQIANDNQFTIEQMEIMPDHVRLLVTAMPNHSIVDMVKALKGVSARFLFKKHPKLKKLLWGGHLWNPSYYISTVGQISEETVREYIENQQKKKTND